MISNILLKSIEIRYNAFLLTKIYYLLNLNTCKQMHSLEPEKLVLCNVHVLCFVIVLNSSDSDFIYSGVDPQ